jgi:hypothetical protein
LIGAFLAAALAVPAMAQDYVVTNGRLTDEDFYRLVACGASPGGPCQWPLVRWPRMQATRLRVQLADPPPGYPRQLYEQLSSALDTAVDEINGAGADIRLVRDTKDRGAEVVVMMVGASDGDVIVDSGVPELDGEIMGAAYVYVWWDGRRQLTEGRILMADDLPEDEVLPVLLEELTQSLGFLTDIRNPIYLRESVFSEDSNSVTRLGPQDIAALRRHYPRPQ